jgi:hypothetical protein
METSIRRQRIFVREFQYCLKCHCCRRTGWASSSIVLPKFCAVQVFCCSEEIIGAVKERRQLMSRTFYYLPINTLERHLNSHLNGARMAVFAGTADFILNMPNIGVIEPNTGIKRRFFSRF